MSFVGVDFFETQTNYGPVVEPFVPSFCSRLAFERRRFHFSPTSYKPLYHVYRRFRRGFLAILARRGDSVDIITLNNTTKDGGPRRQVVVKPQLNTRPREGVDNLDADSPRVRDEELVEDLYAPQTPVYDIMANAV